MTDSFNHKMRLIKREAFNLHDFENYRVVAKGHCF